MILIDANTGEVYDGIIEKVSEVELQQLKSNKHFTFDWSKELEGKVFKIRLEDKKEILGLISLIDVTKEFRIHINLIESSKEYRGKAKKVKNIPGCLISYACKIAFEKGYDGFVSLVPKTQLIDYYHDNYGFVQVGIQMAVFMEVSKLLISKYIGDEEL